MRDISVASQPIHDVVIDNDRSVGTLATAGAAGFAPA